MISSGRSKSFALLGACFVLWLCTQLYVYPFRGRVVDENYHIPQIAAFMRGEWAIDPSLTTIPGYHLVMAGVMKLLSLHSVQDLRMINAVLGLLVACLFYLIRRTYADPQALLYASAFFFLPLLYPYYFLIYTDVFSLTLILLAFLLSLNERHVWAAFVLTLALLVRQNNVIWAAFLPLLCFFSQERPSTIRTGAIAQLRKVAWPYLLPGVIFLLYWGWHGSISLSRAVADKHPDLAFHLGNIYLFFFSIVLLFPHDIVRGMRRYLDVARQKPWLFVIPIFLVAFARLQGNPDNYMGEHYFLHNALIQAVSRTPADLAFAAIVAIGFCGVISAPFLAPKGWLLYPFAAFYLGASWLVENRYLIIPLTLWMAMRKLETTKSLYGCLAAWASVSLFLVWGVFGGKFML